MGLAAGFAAWICGFGPVSRTGLLCAEAGANVGAGAMAVTGAEWSSVVITLRAGGRETIYASAETAGRVEDLAQIAREGEVGPAHGRGTPPTTSGSRASAVLLTPKAPSAPLSANTSAARTAT